MSDILNAIKDNWATIVAPLAGLTTLTAVFKRVTGASRIEANAGNIKRDALTAQTLEDTLKAHPDISSIFFADTERVHFHSRDAGHPPHAVSFQVQTPVFSALKQNLANPAAMGFMLDYPDALDGILQGMRRDGGFMADTKQDGTWVRPRLLKAFLPTTYQQKAHEVNDALLEAVRTLAASEKLKDMTASGSCHIAVKWTDGEQKSHIVVMPTNKMERRLVSEIHDGTRLPKRGITAAGIVQEVTASYRARP